MQDADDERIFDYNHAIALWKLKQYNQAEALCLKVIERYYDLLGISPNDVIGKSPDILWTIIKRTEETQEHLKHIADALELYAKSRVSRGEFVLLARINSMKFYTMAFAPDSVVRVGQDMADDFVGMQDYEGAREVMEQFVLPAVNEAGLVKRLVQVRSQYAVILAYCGQFDDAGAEMASLEPYIEGLTGKQRQEIENQSNYIAQLAYKTLK